MDYQNFCARLTADWGFLLDGQANVLGYETYEGFMK